MPVDQRSNISTMKTVWILLLFLTHILMSYGGSFLPLRALVGSLLIAIIARAAWPRHWKDRLGLRIPSRAVIQAIVLAPILILSLYWMVRVIADIQNITYQSPIAEHGVLSLAYLHTLGQTLNEEMLFGALILFSMRRTFAKISPLLIASLVALAFSLLHFIFYAWIVFPPNSGILTVSALFVLFAIGMLRNTLILRTGNIAYSWSVHFSINLVGLLGLYMLENGIELTESQIFNHILGSQLAVILSFFVLIGCGFSLLSMQNGIQAEMGEGLSDRLQRDKDYNRRE
jgi:membrane protease YdiL (CAAX protease family)